MSTPLVVNVVELLRRPGSSKDVASTVAVSDFEFHDERILPTSVVVDLHLESLSNGITVSGEAVGEWTAECRRCLRVIREPLRAPIDELYQLTIEDPDAYSIDHDQISLLPMVRENLLLALPLAPLCRPDCPGLCATCGADLSDGSCGCAPAPQDDRWSALDALRDSLE
jgi:uncharacterized protein